MLHLHVVNIVSPGENLTNLRIGTTDVNPTDVAPSLSSITKCASQDYPVEQGARQAFLCGETGRYVVIILEGKHTLTVCEVEVFIGNYGKLAFVWAHDISMFIHTTRPISW